MTACGIRKDVVVLGVRDRMEIWDRTSYERYEAAFAGAYQAGTLEPGKGRAERPTTEHESTRGRDRWSNPGSW